MPPGNKKPRYSFPIGNGPFGGARKGSKHHRPPPTIWMLEALVKRGYKFEQELVQALKTRDFDLLDRLIKIAPHIANRPKETVGMEGIENLVIKEFVEDVKTNGNGSST